MINDELYKHRCPRFLALHYHALCTESQLLSAMKLQIHTLPDPTPIPTVFADTAEHDGRYSKGNHTTFSEPYFINAPSELNPPP
jgi:hypothetical protein